MELVSFYEEDIHQTFPTERFNIHWARYDANKDTYVLYVKEYVLHMFECFFYVYVYVYWPEQYQKAPLSQSR
jgi:hypothetical protein